jgi:hypothetical protein
MSLFRFKDAPPEVSSTPFSEFIRTASSEEKKKVYSKVLKRASQDPSWRDDAYESSLGGRA